MSRATNSSFDGGFCEDEDTGAKMRQTPSTGEAFESEPGAVGLGGSLQSCLDSEQIRLDGGAMAVP